MLKQLFSSEVRIQLLSRFLMHPEAEYYGRELADLFETSPRAVHVELRNLEAIHLLRKRISGKQHYYSANTRHPLYPDLQNIFRKTVGLKDVLVEALQQHTASIDYAFIYGSFATGDFTAESDIDILIMGTVSSRKISADLMEAGRTLQREVNFSVFSPREFAQRVNEGDHFLSRLLEQPKLFIIGDAHEFSDLAEEWMAPAS